MGLKRVSLSMGERERMWEFDEYDLSIQFYWTSERNNERVVEMTSFKLLNSHLVTAQNRFSQFQTIADWRDSDHSTFIRALCSFDRINKSNPTIEILLKWFCLELKQWMHIYSTTHESDVCSKYVIAQRMLEIASTFVSAPHMTHSVNL